MTQEEAKKRAGVMLAYAEGKTIQVRNVYCRATQASDVYSTSPWEDSINPSFDWNEHDYRTKPEPSFVPFKTVYEFVEALTVHSGCTDILLKRGSLSYYVMSVDFNSDTLLVGMKGHNGSFRYHMPDMLDFTFTDGTPCGHAIIPIDL